MDAAGVVGVVVEASVLAEAEPAPEPLGARAGAHVGDQRRPTVVGAAFEHALERAQQERGSACARVDDGAPKRHEVSLGREAGWVEAEESEHVLPFAGAGEQEVRAPLAQVLVEAVEPRASLGRGRTPDQPQHRIVAHACREQLQHARACLGRHARLPRQAGGAHATSAPRGRSASDEIVSALPLPATATPATSKKGRTARDSSVGS